MFNELQGTTEEAKKDLEEFIKILDLYNIKAKDRGVYLNNLSLFILFMI